MWRQTSEYSTVWWMPCRVSMTSIGHEGENKTKSLGKISRRWPKSLYFSVKETKTVILKYLVCFQIVFELAPCVSHMYYTCYSLGNGAFRRHLELRHCLPFRQALHSTWVHSQYDASAWGPWKGHVSSNVFLLLTKERKLLMSIPHFMGLGTESWKYLFKKILVN